jgi:hypothetical protein
LIAMCSDKTGFEPARLTSPAFKAGALTTRPLIHLTWNVELKIKFPRSIQ